MPVDIETAIKWMDPETVFERLNARNKRLRIINDSLYIKAKGSGNDPLHCWNSDDGSFVYIRKIDWVKASPAIRRTEACVLLRISGEYFYRMAVENGLKSKKAVPGRRHDQVPMQTPAAYWSIDDLVVIAETVRYTKNKAGWTPASPHELRKMFSNGYVSYKRTQNGEYIPVWDESIF